jgi:hypothetical protein
VSIERANGRDGLGVGVSAPVGESGRERGILVVRKYDRQMVEWAARRLGWPGPGERGHRPIHQHQFDQLDLAPYETVESLSNLITTAGWGRMLDKALGVSGQAYDATHTRIGVGTATAAAAVGNTDLSASTGASNRRWELVTGVGGTGTGTGTVRMTFVATFGTGDANFAWQEWGIDQGTAAGTGASTTPLLNRAVSNQGTKASGQIWTASALLDFT